MRRVVRGTLLTAAMLALAAGSAYAQARGSIFGKVTDASGGVLPGVTVTWLKERFALSGEFG